MEARYEDWHALEKAALVLDRQAVMQLQNAFRRTRMAIETLLAKRYSDGELDRVACVLFEDELARIAYDAGIGDE